MSIKYILEAVDKITPTLNKVKTSFDAFNKSFDKLKNKKLEVGLDPTMFDNFYKNAVKSERFF
jgi:hypothetical protein